MATKTHCDWKNCGKAIGEGDDPCFAKIGGAGYVNRVVDACSLRHLGWTIDDLYVERQTALDAARAAAVATDETDDHGRGGDI